VARKDSKKGLLSGSLLPQDLTSFNGRRLTAVLMEEWQLLFELDGQLDPGLRHVG